jgi:hypothetical protein
VQVSKGLVGSVAATLMVLAGFKGVGSVAATLMALASLHTPKTRVGRGVAKLTDSRIKPTVWVSCVQTDSRKLSNRPHCRI